MKKTDELRKKLTYERKNFWNEASAKEQKDALKLSEGYKNFLDKCKTERESIEFYVKELEKQGYKEIENGKKSKKVFRVSRNKNAGIAFIGKRPVSEGVNLIVSHIDAPRVDLKQNPLYEDGTTNLGMMK